MVFSGKMKLQAPVQRRRTAAFTLVEVLFAVVVLATVAIAFYAALSSGFAVVQSARENLRATQIMTQKLEAVRLCRWDQLGNFSFVEPYDPIGTNRGTLFSGTVMTNAASIVPDTCAYKPNMRQVTVTLTWTNTAGPRPMTCTRQMKTNVARYGLQNYIWGIPAS